MIHKPKFNPVRDIEKVVPKLSVDVAEVMATHQVPSTGTTTPYNDIDSPGDMGHYCTDKIQTAIAAMHLGQSMANPPASSSPSPVSHAGTPPAE